MFSSPITTIFGTVIIVLTWLNQAFVEQGIPKDGKGWITFLIGNATGLAGLFAKDFNKSNASNSVATHVVTEVK
jgi:hypothetical protein